MSFYQWEYQGLFGSSEHSNADVFYFRFLPALITGMFVWTSTIYWGSTLFPTLDIWSYIIAIVGWFLFWILGLYFAVSKMNVLSLISFFLASFLNGVLTIPLFEFGVAIVGRDEAIGLAVTCVGTATAVIVVLGVVGYLNEALFRARSFVLFLMTATFVLVIFEIIVLIFHGFGAYLITSTVVILLTFGYVLLDAAWLRENMREGFWMLSVMQFFLDFVILVTRLFLLLLVASARD